MLTKGDDGTVHLHIFQPEVWSEEPYHRVDCCSNKQHEDLCERGS